MTPEYKARRAANHAAQRTLRAFGLDNSQTLPTIDLTPKTAGHAFVGLKTHPQGNGGRKNRSGYAQEHAQANIDNAKWDILNIELEPIDILKK